MMSRSAKILAWSTVAVLSFLFLWDALDLGVSHSENHPPEDLSSLRVPTLQPQVTGVPADTSAKPDAVTQKQEWCDPEGSQELANHSVFQEFSNWLTVYEKISPLQPSVRSHANLLSKGVEISRVRARVLGSLIRVDPESALARALAPERMQDLPLEISQNMEAWHSVEVDFKAMHVCFNPQNPKGMIHRWVTVPDGRTFRAYVYGKRKFMPTLRNVVISGVSLGDVMAVSENAHRLVGESTGGKQMVEYAGRKLAVSKNGGIEALERRVREADLLALRDKTFRNPLVASSTGDTNLNNLRYELVTTPMTWADANQTAFQKNGRLVCINNSTENNIVYQLIKDAMALGLMPDGAGAVKYSWIGATDSADQDGTFFDKDANQTKSLLLDATEGDWHWLSNEDVSAGYQNWAGGNEPNDPTKNFGAMDWTTADGKWIDLNGSDDSYRLPFVIEYDIDLTPTPTSFVNGKRKVLIVPARFRDEGNNFDGSSSNSNDPFGNPATPGQSKDAFEPDSRENLIQVMNEVRDFYLRNSDGTFQMDAVITPTVTIDLPKWERVAAGSAGAVDNRIFDSTGTVYWSKEVDYADKEIGEVGVAAVWHAAQISRLYDFHGPAFQGVISVDINNSGSLGTFTKPPQVEFRGGNIDATTGSEDPDFVPAQGKALVDDNGLVTQILVTDPGAFYHSAPDLFLDDVNKSGLATFTLNRTVVSWAAVSTTGSGGLGIVGGPGSHVSAPSDAGVMAHELGHNFGLWHSNRYVSYGLRANSDEGENIDYGNPYSLMGGGGITGDLTISSKVFLRDVGHFGLKGGTGQNNAIDVAHLFSNEAVETSGLQEADATNPNTFRIYQHDHGSAPYPLRTGEFKVSIPDAVKPPALLGNDKKQFDILIGGPGEGADGNFTRNGEDDYTLKITSGGKGYSEEPFVQVLDDGDKFLLTLDSGWIQLKAGTSSDSYEQSDLRDFADNAHRGLRGVEIPASEYAPLGPDAETPSGSYWVSYRRSASKYGLSIINGTTQGFGTSENALIDTTTFTQGNFEDAFLLLGRTFSDYESDSHVTPVKKGGIAPMEYIEVVVNVGTVAKGEARAPEFEIQVSNSAPAVNETVSLTVIPMDDNITDNVPAPQPFDWAYSWYQNELPLSDIRYMNKRTMSRAFSTAGQHVIKVIVSDMKGGVSSENVVIHVGDREAVQTSLVSGQVQSPKGPVQGAKVLISKLPIIEHTVSVSGKLQDSRIPSYTSNPLQYVIDNEAKKQLLLHRGEIHRFYFDPSTEGIPLSFFEHPDHGPAQVKLNLLLTPLVDFGGKGYTTPPKVELLGGSLFDSHFSDSDSYSANTVTTLYDYQQDLPNEANLPKGTLITLPYAKSLLKETSVSKIIVRPISSDPDTGLYVHYGGTGHTRDNTPVVNVKRDSYWEDFTKTSASAIAYVDGVGTITVDSGGSGYSTTPKIVVFGAGQDANVTATMRAKKNSDGNQKSSQILDTLSISDQGHRFDPNSTMAIAQYPFDPIIYYSFDANESLFEDNAVYKPTSGFNNRITTGLAHHWRMDETNATNVTFEDNFTGTPGNRLTIKSVAPAQSTTSWGIQGKAIRMEAVNNFTLTGVLNAGDTSVSAWVYFAATGGAPSVNFNIGGTTLTGSSLPPASSFSFGLDNGTTILKDDKWYHFAIVFKDTSSKLYVNGKDEGITGPARSGTNIVANIGGDYLLDELMVYDRALEPFEIKQMSGRIFLDLSGNKYHAVPMGDGFDMLVWDPAGADNGLGDGRSTDLGQGLDLNGSQYLDLMTNQKALSALEKGTVSFWANPEPPDITRNPLEENPILSASDLDKNNTYYRLFIRQNGTIRQEVMNDGSELCKITSGASDDLYDTGSSGGWHHVAVLVDDGGVQFYINGKSVSSVVPSGSSNDRAFFTDLDKISHLAIGHHKTSDEANATYYEGELDEFHIYNRVLSNAEIKYLYNLGNDNKVERARLTASVDAIGTVMITNAGDGYKEQPLVDFNYTNAHPGEQAVGRAELEPAGVDQILLTKDFYEPVQITLPDGSTTTRRYVEYVQASPATTPDGAKAAKGLFGYSAPPNIVVEGSPAWPEDDSNATAYPLMFLDPNASVEIVNGGQGYDLGIHTFSYSGAHYQIIKENRSWADAAQDAAARGGFLAEINDPDEQNAIFAQLANASITAGETLAPLDGGNGAYLWIGGNDRDGEGTWLWEGDNLGSTTQFWDGGSTGTQLLFSNWGTTNNVQNEPDNFAFFFFGQDALAISLNGWPLGLAGQWNDLDEDNQLYYVVEYPVGVFPASSAVRGGFETDAVRIFGEGYRPPEFEASIQAGGVASLILKKPGEGNFEENATKLYFLGDGWQETSPNLDMTGNGPFVNGNSLRRNTFSATANDNLFELNGIKLDSKNPGTGWKTAPTVFADWGNTNYEGHVGVSKLEFNSTLSDVVVQNPGFRYSIPAKVNLFGGQFFDSETGSVFRPAIVEINATDANGSIVSYNVVDGGAGYVRAPIVSVTGGGGVGATALAFVNIFDGNITAVFSIDGGRGYHNLDANNTPVARLSYNHVLAAPSERDANITLRLGGNLNKPTIEKKKDDPQYITPWVEIFDRGRANVPVADRAEAVAKVKNGIIEKIIVTKSGRGYIDPVVAVRGSPPKLAPYFADGIKRQWQCTHMREDVNGILGACGHIHEGDNPPDSCPGETPPGPKQVSAAAHQNWWNKHAAVCRNPAHVHADYSNHQNGTFKVRSCGGIPSEFVLINDPYRASVADWADYDAKCSALVLDGMIREIVMENNGARYISPHLEFKGTGGEVDAVPVFDEQGYLIDVFFDDPRIANLEIDKVTRPLGAGQGFTERPWTKDGNFDAVFGPREIVTFLVHSDMAFAGDGVGAILPGIIPDFLLPQTSHVYTTVTPRDSWGDRVVDVEVLDGGLFAQGTEATVQIDFNNSFYDDNVSATAIARFTNRLTKMELDHNGTHTWADYPNPSGGSPTTVTRSTFLAEPEVTIFNEFFDDQGAPKQYSFFLDENKTSQIRLNGVIDYDPVSERSYFDLVVDERLPNKFYYGLGDSNRSFMGGEILVGEGMPYANWGSTEQFGAVAYTDANGFYAVSGLEPGLYNVAVVMEDEKYQELTFRPDSNASLISRTVYVPGFSPLELETDRRGLGKSRLIWPASSRNQGRTATPNDPPDPLKVLEGIGGGFVTGEAIHLSFDPHPENSSKAVPKVSYEVSIDGSLKLSIVDDQDSSSFDPEDRFTLKYASPINISGVDFTEDFRFDDLNQSFWGGSMSVANKPQLIISPNAGGSANFFEVPIASSSDPNATMTFTIKGYDENGSIVMPQDLKDLSWSLLFDFNVTDGNYSKIASLDSNQSEQVKLTLRSTLRDGNMTLLATAKVAGHSTEASLSIISFKRVPLTERELWMDQYFDTVWESAVNWNANDDSDPLVNEEEWTYRTNPLYWDTDGDGLGDYEEINGTKGYKTNPLSSDTDGDTFSDSLEIEIDQDYPGVMNPLSYNLAAPPPEISLIGGNQVTSEPGGPILLKAIASEYDLNGSGLVPIPIFSMSGSFSQVVKSLGNDTYSVNASAPPGVYTVVYSFQDSYNRIFSQNQTLRIVAPDETPPVITLSNPGPIYVLKGGSFTWPTYTAYDETDGDITSQVVVSGKDDVDVNSLPTFENNKTYVIRYSVSDQSGKTSEVDLQVVVENYRYTIVGKAIDGYLVGSTVIFDAFKNGVLDGVHDLASPVTTDGSGQFVLSFTTPEFNMFDTNQNGMIDPTEGRIVVSGGRDVTTGVQFNGSYSADANSTVVSPLSTLVTAVMDDGTGMTKEQALNQVVKALMPGLPDTIDPTNFDPLAAAAGGDDQSAQVLRATARLANMMNQAHAFAVYRGIPFTSAGQAGSNFIGQLADDIAVFKDGDASPLDNDALIEQSLVSALQAIQPGTTDTEANEAVQLMRLTDSLLEETFGTFDPSKDDAAKDLAVGLAKNQQAIASTVILGYAGLPSSGQNISSLNVTDQTLKDASVISSINVFPPTAAPFVSSVRAGDWSAGKQLASLSATDADDHTITYSITSANFDLDGDGTPPFSISSSGVLSISDTDDLTPYAATTMEVTVLLDDGHDMNSTVQGSLQVDNLLSLTSSPISGIAGWADSSWLGNFYSAGSSWVYHPSMGWIYVSPDNANGFWFWDKELNTWWWAKPGVFPHFYRNDTGWSYWDLSGSSRRYYDYVKEDWNPTNRNDDI